MPLGRKTQQQIWQSLGRIFTRNTDKQGVDGPKAVLTELRALFAKFEGLGQLTLSTPNRASAEEVLGLVMDFYDQEKLTSTLDIEDSDMLLFQYGHYDWDGTGQKFELDLTRQFMTSSEGDMYQMRLTLFYPSTEIGEITPYSLWHSDLPTMNDWKRTVLNTEGFRRASASPPSDYFITLGEV